MPDTFLSASEMVRRLRDGDFSCRELMQAHLDQIERVNPTVNAIVTLLPERALEAADEADRALAAGDDVGCLHGLPIAHKDLVVTRGIRTTYGSPIYADNVPDEDALIVERLRAAGALTIGKTNTPEFGAGSQTFNPVFGATSNPYALDKTCGGSSGGAAVALACGMLPIADGSDTGGSLRNPASFCNVVGFRPSPGRVPIWPNETAWFPISVQGPMARRVEDVALMLSAIAGPDPRSPIAIREPGERFRESLDRDFRGTKIAWSLDLGEIPVDSRIANVLGEVPPVFRDLGCTVETRHPHFEGADECFKILRGWRFAIQYSALIESHRDLVKDTVISNTEYGEKLSGPDIGRAEVLKTRLYHRVREFLEEFEFLIMPVTQVPPFDINQPYVTEINGTELPTYIDWMKSCYYITVTGLPALSVPAGFTEDGLPVGLQIVGRHEDDFGVLQLGHAFEKLTAHALHRPPVCE